MSAPVDAPSDDVTGDSPELKHSFLVHNYKIPTKCSHCRHLLVGFTKQGLHCKGCKMNVHQDCSDKLTKSCK
ncbi:protein kinase C epsilon type-like [Clavelina lepadiformis]|uniref:Phorbol-ester/DAG-type domain-containing protein n=1 Tax=Clavelina lepadiformis TaxID=159417 RepID=A0ABP0GSV1_CLALP